MSLGDEYKEELVYGSFWHLEVPGEGEFNFPTTDYTVNELRDLYEVDEIDEVTGYFVEVCEEETMELLWHGPFGDENEAACYLEDLLG